MNKRPLKYLEFTIKELQKFVNDENSCVKRINNEMHIGFPPWGIATFKESLIGILKRNKIGKYDEKLGGIILDVRNIKVQGNNYLLQNDSPDLHINLIADFYVFIPTIGCIIEGTIKHIAPGHISVTLYHLFNVTIQINAAKQKHLKIDSEVLVKITNFNLGYTIPSIQGELYIDTKKRNNAKNSVSNVVHTSESLPAINGQNGTSFKSSSSETDTDDTDSDNDDDNIQFKQKIEKEILNAIKIKQEKRSSSEHDTNSSSGSSDSSEIDKKISLQKKLLKRKIKKETLETPPSSTSESDTSSSSSDDEDKTNIKIENQKNIKNKIDLKKIKRKKSESSSDDDSSSNYKKIKPLATTNGNGVSSINKIEQNDEEMLSLGSPLLSSTVINSKKQRKSQVNDTSVNLKSRLMKKMLSKFK